MQGEGLPMCLSDVPDGFGAMPLPPPALISPSVVEAFWRDGVVPLRGLASGEEVDALREAVERRLRATHEPPIEVTRQEGGEGRFALDRLLWWRDDGFKTFLQTGKSVSAARTLLDATQKVNLLDDQIFVKEPGTSSLTPWHQDLSFWAVAGRQLCSIWLALDPVDKSSGGLTFVRGSHLWGRQFQALGVRIDPSLCDPAHEPVPEIDADPTMPMMDFRLEAGDAVVFHALTLHSAGENRWLDRRRRAYVTRWAGDDVVYSPRPHSSQRHVMLAQKAGLSPGEPIDCLYYPRLWAPGSGERSDVPRKVELRADWPDARRCAR